MSLDGNARAQAAFAPIKAKNDADGAAGKPVMSQADLDAVLAGMQRLYAADTTYLQGNAEIAPGTLAANTGIPVSTTGSPAAQTGTTTAPGPLAAAGRGKLL